MADRDLLDQATSRIQVELATRRLIVLVLGLLAIAIGTVMIVTGAPAFIENWFSPWSRVLLGGTSALFGFMAVFGLLYDHRLLGWLAHIGGLIGLCLWYTAIGSAYTGLLVVEGPQWANLGEPLASNVSGRGYVPLIYLGLFMINLIPLVAALKAGRPYR